MEIRVGNCPLCGAPLRDHDHAGVLKNEEIDRLIVASEAEEISENVIEAFYLSLAKSGEDEQIIVLENEDPPEQIHNSINYIHFSKSSVGRYGFFPIA